MSAEVDIRGRKHGVGMLEGEAVRGPKCKAEFGQGERRVVCGQTASPHFCEPRVLRIEKGLGELRHPEIEGEFAPLDWQREWIVEPLFGVVVWDEERDMWARRYRMLWCSVPRKQGKSMIVAAITALMMLTAPPESDMLLGAQNLEEAQRVMGAHVRRFVESSPAWKDVVVKKLEFLTAKNVSCRIKAINHSDSARGAAWAVAVLDEIAFYNDPEESLQVVRASWGAIREPLILSATTLRGDAGSWGRVNNLFMLEALEDPDMAPDVLPVISMIRDDEDWRDEATWLRVCPALAEGVQSMKDFRLLAKQAEENFGVRQKFLTEYLNAPALTDAAYIPVDVWRAQKEVGVGRDGVFDGLMELRSGVYGGADFSRVSDFTSVALVGMRDDKLWVWQQSWVPAPVAASLDKKLSGRVSEWLGEGFLRVLPEGVTSAYVAEELEKLLKGFRGVDLVGYDPHDALEAEKYWDSKGRRFEACPQGPVLSPAIKTLEDLATAGLVVHGGDPVLEYAVASAEIKINDKEKWTVRKPERKVSAARVDPLVAVLTAFHTRNRNMELQSGYTGGRWVTASGKHPRRKEKEDG